MKSHGVDGYLIPLTDPHKSEYISPRDQRAKFISGFGGTSGLGFVTQDRAMMWTDGRYYIQAKKELEEGWEMMKMEVKQKNWRDVAVESSEKAKIKIGYDPLLEAIGELRKSEEIFKERKSGVSMEAIEGNLVDEIWGEEQPGLPREKVFIHAEKYTGRSIEDNIKAVMSKVEKASGEALILTSLDEIAWFTNLRGKDIAFNPLFFSYAIVHKVAESYQIRLYIDSSKVEAVGSYLEEKKISVFPYE